jgi:transcriptional regulator with XRE-family HTH domain
MSHSAATENIQSVFLEQIRQRLPKNLSLADELAEILNVSRDSVYRRMRGETVLSLEEVKKLCLHYKISLDSLLSPSSEIISFHKRSIDAVHFTFENWLQSLLHNLEMINSFPEREVIYCAKDIPPFFYFKFPGLALFKMFFWMKSYYRYPQYADAQYKPELVPGQFLVTGKRLWEKYADIPSSEIWSDETFNVTIRQVEFYRENGFIALEEAHALLDEYKVMVNDIRGSAARGKKNEQGEPFNLYKNDFLISDTTILFKMNDKRVAFITYNTMNVLSTSQESFCEEMDDYLTNIINKSILISTTGERERNKFFNHIEERIKRAKELLR